MSENVDAVDHILRIAIILIIIVTNTIFKVKRLHNVSRLKNMRFKVSPEDFSCFTFYSHCHFM